MKLLILGEHEVEQLLTMRECIRVMDEALADLARGKVANPLRNMVRAEGAAGFLGLMPAYRGDFGLKEICVFPENPKRGLDTHLGCVILHDGETGAPNFGVDFDIPLGYYISTHYKFLRPLKPPKASGWAWNAGIWERKP